MKKREAAGILLLLGVAGLILWWFCGLIRGPSHPAFAHVDKIEPEIPGLIIEEFPYVVGAFDIINETGQDVYLFDQQGHEIIKITPDEVYEKNEKNNWVSYKKGSRFCFAYPPVRYEGPVPTKWWKKQVLSEWVVEGRVGDTPFKIYGRTVYEP